MVQGLYNCNSSCSEGTGETDIGNVKGNTTYVIATTTTVPLAAPTVGKLIKENPGVAIGLGITTVIVVSQEVSKELTDTVKEFVIGMPDKHPWDKLPSSGSISFNPPVDKAGNPLVKKGPNGGVLDKYGREWTRDKAADKVGNGHWDVQLPNGDHINVNGDDTNNPGEINHGKSKDGKK